MRNFWNKRKFEILAFAIPLLACVIMCAIMGMWPFGSDCLLHMDMYHQYCPFFTEFADKLKHGESLFYTWNLGLGSDFVSLYAYYLASPLNWLLILFPSGWMIEVMTIMEFLKIAACGLCMYIFLKNHWCDGEKKESPYAALVFSLAYAISGFIAAYSWDIMWLDCVALAPLILLGLERLVREGKVKLYTIALALCIWSNYYISIIICIFVVFYFGWLFFTNTGKGKAFLHFCVYSLLAGGMSAVLLLPEIVVLSYSGSSAGTGLPETMEWYFHVIAEFGRMCTTTEVYTGASEHWPNLYCGAFCILLMVLYGFNRNIKLQRKIPAYCMLVFFLISFSNNYLDFIWHGFHFPQSLPGRQSFLFIFLVLTMSYECWNNRENLSRVQIIIGTGVAALFMGAAAFLGDSEITAWYSFLVTGLFWLLYLLVYFLGKKLKLTYILFVIAIAELITNMAVTGFYMTSRSSYTQNNRDYEALIEAANEAEDGDFFRIEDVERLTKNDSAYHDYSSATVFSSLMNLDISHFYQSVYMEGGKNYYCYNGATPLTSAMLSVDYVISKDELPENPYHELVMQSGNLYLYHNTYSLPVAYVLDEDVILGWDNTYSVSSDRIDNLNELATLLGANDSYLERLEPSNVNQSEGQTSFTIPEDGYYFAGYVTNSGETINMTTSSGYSRKFSKTSHRYLLELGQFEAGEEITLTGSSDEIVSYHLYRLNEQAFLDAYDTISQEEFEVTEYSDTTIKGTIETNGGRLIFSVPYVPGWTLYVDGEETEIDAFCDAFISVSLSEGTHEVELVYETPYIKLGALISAFSLVVFLILLLGRRFLPWKRKPSVS